jgi:hypothetical protein
LTNAEGLVQAAQREVLDSYRREYDMLSAGFRDLDGKAQGSAAVAGAFLAAGLALLNRPGSLRATWLMASFTLVVVVLMCAILLSVQALRIRKLRAGPSGDEVSRLLKAIRESPERELPERLLYFYGDTAELWASCIRDRRMANERKARLVWLSQVCLTVSALCVASMIVGIIWEGR